MSAIYLNDMIYDCSGDVPNLKNAKIWSNIISID